MMARLYWCMGTALAGVALSAGAFLGCTAVNLSVPPNLRFERVSHFLDTMAWAVCVLFAAGLPLTLTRGLRRR